MNNLMKNLGIAGAGLALLAGCSTGNVQENTGNNRTNSEKIHPAIVCSYSPGECEKEGYETFAGVGSSLDDAKSDALRQAEMYFGGVSVSSQTTVVTTSRGRSSDIQTSTDTSERGTRRVYGGDIYCEFPQDLQTQDSGTSYVTAYCQSSERRSR